jgi:hypothetical protein
MRRRDLATQLLSDVRQAQTSAPSAVTPITAPPRKRIATRFRVEWDDDTSRAERRMHGP